MSFCKKLIVIYLCVNLFSPILSEVNISHIYGKRDRNVPPAVDLESEKTNIIESQNISYYDDFDCGCGPYSKGCYVIGDDITCLCKYGYGQRGSQCVECDCGFRASGCSFVDDEKICQCESGYAPYHGTCTDCECGDHSKGCSYENGRKTCDCSYGYSQRWDKCEECYCDTGSTGCEFENGRKKCSCSSYYAPYGDEKCKYCFCGFSKGCKFKNYVKECSCYENYIEDYYTGECRFCYCGPQTASCKFTFDNYTRCTCKEGFVAKRTKWEMDEYCETSGSGWRTASYVVGVFFAVIIAISACIICVKKCC